MFEHLRFFRRRLPNSFWFLPLLGCLLCLGLAVALRMADSRLALQDLGPAWDFLAIAPANASTVLSTIAGAMATMVSLVYSLTLVVFTLAAGNLGPRLLESFSNNRVNQFTIAITGGTFLFSLSGLYLMELEGQARLTVAAAIFLAVLSIATLIYFVHDVAGRVLVDNEVARAASRLDKAVDKAFLCAPAEPAVVPTRTTIFTKTLVAEREGYIVSLDPAKIVGLAKTHNGIITLRVQPGDFVIPGMVLADLRTDTEPGDVPLERHIVYGAARTADHDVLFGVRLLVEIALRALSPGINDSYTAVSCVDHLSRPLSCVVQRHPRSAVLKDAAGDSRVVQPVIDAEGVLSKALGPLRRNARDNLILQSALLQALTRLAALSLPAYRPIIRQHIDLVASEALETATAAPDRAQIIHDRDNALAALDGPNTACA